MIDSVALTWGGSTGTEARRARGVAEPVSGPIRLDLREMHERFSEFGSITVKRFEDGKTFVAGHWKPGDIEILYSNGTRLEVRASLPKVLTGAMNDVVLDEPAVHEALRRITAQASELIEQPLSLRDAVPTRIDYVIQWKVESVARQLADIKRRFHPPRLKVTENVSPKGGRSVVYGYGLKRVLRFYDKGAEVAERLMAEASHGLPAEALIGLNEIDRQAAIAKAKRLAREQIRRDAEIDTHLRFEVQDRRSPTLRLIHEHGWLACDVRAELVGALAKLDDIDGQDFAGFLGTFNPADPNYVARAGGAMYFAEHPEALAAVRECVSNRAYYKWRRSAARAASFVAHWTPTIAATAFEKGTPCSVWDREHAWELGHVA